MKDLLLRLQRVFGGRRNTMLSVAGVQPLASGVVVYVIDVDGRRIVVGATPHAICVLDRYRVPKPENRAGAAAAGA